MYAPRRPAAAPWLSKFTNVFHSGGHARTLGVLTHAVAAGKDVLGDMDMSETTAPATTAIVSPIYATTPCNVQSGNAAVVPETVIDVAAGPALLLWQGSAWANTVERAGGMQPAVGNSDPIDGASCFFNQTPMHLPLLRQRALVSPLPQGESLVGITASNQFTNTDANDSVTAALLAFGSMSAPPQVRLAGSGMAMGGGSYTSQVFDCGGNDVVVSVAATAWAEVPNTLISAVLYLDGDPIAYPMIFANPSGVHMPLNAMDIRLSGLAPGGHQLDLTAGSNTVVDDSDVWSLTVMEMQGISGVTQLFENDVLPEQPGGQPIAKQVYQAGGGEQLILVSMSAWSQTPGRMLSALVLVDNDPVGTLQTYANQAGMHLALTGGDFAPGVLPPGQHAITVVAGPGTVTDENDRLCLAVLELFR